MSMEEFENIEWVAEQLRLDWRERQFLTDREAIGTALEEPVARKRTATEKGGGALSRFASEAALKHLQAAGWIRSIKVQKIGDDNRPSVGWMRLWPLLDVMKAELALALAEHGDLHLMSAVQLLRPIPGDGSTVPAAEVICGSWVRRTLFWFALESTDADIVAAAREAIEGAPESEADYPSDKDPTLRIVDRRWLFGRNLPLAPQYNTGNEWEILADIKSLANRTFDVEFLFSGYTNFNSPNGREVELSDDRVSIARRALTQPVASVDLSLAEPLRRFLHRNRKGGQRQAL